MFLRGFTTLLAVSWLLVANHCLVSAALAAPAKTAHHCGPSDGTAPAGPHHGCTKEVCCELFAPLSSGGHDLSPSGTLHLPPSGVRFVPNLGALFPPPPRWAVIPPAAGPPGDWPALLRSLSLAQNAPPPTRAA
jgi:hypothetical protein